MTKNRSRSASRDERARPSPVQGSSAEAFGIAWSADPLLAELKITGDCHAENQHDDSGETGEDSPMNGGSEELDDSLHL
jgi:hypothetical protein